MLPLTTLVISWVKRREDYVPIDEADAPTAAPSK